MHAIDRSGEFVALAGQSQLGRQLKTAIIYLRVSTGKQAEKELPLESQLEKCREKAQALGVKVLRVFSDRGVSGRTDRRPEFQAALSFCEENEIDYFITWSTSRFARNTVEAKLNKRRLSRCGTEVAYVTVTIDQGSDSGFLHESILELFDEYYSRQVSTDTSRSMRKNARDGYWNGGPTPFGYRVIKAPEDPKRRKLVPDELEAGIVRRIFNLRKAGTGGKSIALELNRAGLLKRGKPWAKNSVIYLLRSQIVTGYMTYGKRTADGEVRPESDWIRVPSHEAIVPEALWQQVQTMMDADSSGNQGGGYRSTWLFTGFIHCRCGAPMRIETAKGRSKRYSYYGCSGKFQGETGCSGRRISAPDLDAWLLTQIVDRIFNSQSLRGFIREFDEAAGHWAKEYRQRVAVITEQLEPLKEKRGVLFSRLEDPDCPLDMSDLAPRLREYNTTIKDLEYQLAVLDMQRPEDPEITAADVMKLQQAINHVISNADPKVLRKFLSGFIDSVVIRDSEVNIRYRPEALVTGNQEAVPSAKFEWLPLLDSNQRHMD